MREIDRHPFEKPHLSVFWRVLQIAIVMFFVLGDIHWGWGMGGLAAGVAGGMVAWYATFIVSRTLWNMGLGPRFGIEGAPSISLLYRPPAPDEQPPRTSVQHRDPP